ncbi:MAG: helix-turn-helix domain-containing protein [Nanoarchaeota archaeon]|nr:helix-turn-helix domain-containing protein [Nanoarchaeota archaeon]
MENIKQFLGSIGFGKNETEIYSSLIKIGRGSVLEISRETKLHRSNIYDAVRSLVQKGLIFEINSGTKIYIPKQLESLKYYLKNRETELDELIKDLKQTLPQKEEEVKFKMIKGRFALRESIHNLLNYNDTIYEFGIPENAEEIIGPMIHDFHAERKKRKISMLQIYNHTAIDSIKPNKKMDYTEIRVLPKHFDSSVTTVICKNSVMFYLWDRDLTVIEMNDERIAKTYKSYFDILWSRSKKLAAI